MSAPQLDPRAVCVLLAQEQMIVMRDKPVARVAESRVVLRDKPYAAPASRRGAQLTVSQLGLQPPLLFLGGVKYTRVLVLPPGHVDVDACPHRHLRGGLPASPQVRAE